MNYNEVKRKVIDRYGKVCFDCGNQGTRLRLFSEDGSVAQLRAEKGLEGGNSFYRWLLKNDFPDLPIIILCKECFFKRKSAVQSGKKRSREQIERMKEAQKCRRNKDSQKRRQMWANDKMKQWLEGPKE